eukprot:12556019-Alexandrium_andersonii.AAC.1
MATSEMQKLGSAILGALYPGAAASRSRALGQWLTGRAVVDPWVYLVVSRAVALRRQWCKFGETAGLIEAIL